SSAGAAWLSNTVNWRSPASREPVKTSISISFPSCRRRGSGGSGRETGQCLAHAVRVGIGQPGIQRQREQLREDLVRGRKLTARVPAQQVAEVRQLMNRDEMHGRADAGFRQPL